MKKTKSDKKKQQTLKCPIMICDDYQGSAYTNDTAEFIAIEGPVSNVPSFIRKAEKHINKHDIKHLSNKNNNPFLFWYKENETSEVTEALEWYLEREFVEKQVFLAFKKKVNKHMNKHDIKHLSDKKQTNLQPLKLPKKNQNDVTHADTLTDFIGRLAWESTVPELEKKIYTDDVAEIIVPVSYNRKKRMNEHNIKKK